MLNSIRKPSSFPLLIASTVAVAAILSLCPQSSRAAPVGGVVTNGAATISASGLVTTINQSTDRAVIDWSSFNLAQNETALFVVPSDTGATLNRITGGGVSTISGSVESNGTVYFSNPNGLVFDANSRVTANGFIATTGTISNFDFMNRGEFSNLGNSGVTLNGVISAPAITAQAGTVTVGGNLSAGSGKILLTSSSLTTIGLGATISASAGANGSGGNVKVWSDNHTDFLGAITARGGTNSGDGGLVEVSGKKTLNFKGTVSTLAPHGKTGSLLLDPETFEIVNTAGGTQGISYITVSTLEAALNTTHVSINANTSTITGFSYLVDNSGTGLITIKAAVLPTAGSWSLTLTGSQIIINANLTVLGGLSLNSTRGSVWQDPGTIITAPTLSGSSVDGFSLGGANKFSNIGTITNSGTAGILVKNDQALTINAGTIDGGTGGVMILAPNFDVTLGGAVTVKGSYLRLDAGSGKLLGGATLTANGLDVLYTSATSLNNATIAVGSGSFTFVNDQRSVVTAKNLTNSSAQSEWGTGLGSLVSGTASGGLTVTTSGAASTITHQGVVYGGTVTITGVTAAATNGANNLRYIEGTGVGVTTTASAFSGSLMLVGNGAGITVGANIGTVVVNANLATGTALDGTSHLTLVQHGTNSASGIIVKSATVTAGGNISLTQFGKNTNFAINQSDSSMKSGNRVAMTQVGSVNGQAVFISDLSVTAVDLSLVQSGSVNTALGEGIILTSLATALKGNMTVTQSGIAGAQGIKFNVSSGRATIKVEGDLFVTQSGTAAYAGISTELNDFKVKGSIFLEQSGVTADSGFYLVNSSFNAGNSIFVSQSGKAATNGIYVFGSSLSAGGDVSLIQTGTSGTGASHAGIRLQYYTGTKGVALTAGSNRWVTLKTNNTRLVLDSGDDFTISAGKLRVDLGSAIITSTGTGTPAAGYRLQASGVETYYTGATTGNNAQLSLGAGNFVFVTDNRATITATTIGSATVLPTAVTVTGLTVTTTGNTAGKGVVYGGTVDISGVTSAMVAKDLRYIEGTGIGVTTASTFAGSLVLVSSGAGFTAGSVTAGILVNAALTTGGGTDTASSLTLIQTGQTSGTGIKVAAVLTSYGSMLVNQAGRATYGINLSSSLILRAGADLSVIQSGYSTSADTAAIVLDNPATFANTTGLTLSIQQTGYSASTKAIRFNSSEHPSITSHQKRLGTVLFKTNNRDLIVDKYVDFDKTKILVINLGTGHLIAPTFSAQSAAITATGVDTFFTGAATGHSGAIYVGDRNNLSAGSFTFVTDYSNNTDAVTIDNSSSASQNGLGWDTGLQGVTPVLIDPTNDPLFKSFAYAGGFKVTTRAADSTVQRVGIKFGGTVTISGVSTGDARKLNYIEAGGIAVSGTASSFSNSLTLVSNGIGISSGTDMAGIVVMANLTAGISNDGISNLTLIQNGASTGHGILIGAASLTAGGNLSLQQLGTVASSKDGLYFNATGTAAGSGVGLVASISGSVTIKASNKNLSLNNNDNFSVSGSKLRIDLGTAAITSATSAGGTVPTDGYGLKADGMELLFIGAKTGNRAIFAVGGGSFTYVSDQSAILDNNLTIDATTTLTSLGLGSVSYGGSSGARTLGGLKITGQIDAALQGLGIIYSNTAVAISGVTKTPASEAAKLTYIEGKSIAVSGTASSFNGALTLVSTESQVTRTVNNVPVSAGIVVATNLTVGAASDGTSHLTLIRNGSPNQGDGIAILAATLTAGGNISLIQNDTINGVSGIELAATTTTGVVFTAGSNNHWVTFKTNNYKLGLKSNNNFSVSRGQVRIDLGTASMTSITPKTQGVLDTDSAAPGNQTVLSAVQAGSTAAPSGGYSLTTTGLNVYYTGSTVAEVQSTDAVTNNSTITTHGNNATIALGATGTFTFVSDLRGAVATSVGNTAVSLGSFTAGATSGLTLTGTTTTVKTGIVGNQVTVSGLNSGANQTLSYIEGNGVTVSGTASTFTGGLLLRATGNSSLSLGGDLSATGALRLDARGMSLTKDVTATTVGGWLFTIDLGQGGVYNNGTGTGYSLSTGGQSLAITAASIANTAATNAIFRLGSSGGTLTVAGGLALAVFSAGAGATYTNNGTGIVWNDTSYGKFNTSGVKYYFVNTAADETSATTALTTAGVTNFIVLRASALTASNSNLGTRTDPAQTFTYSKAGLAVHTTGDYFWQANGSTYTSGTTINTDIILQNGHEVHFYGLTAISGTMPSTTPSWLSTSTGIIFDGANSFSSGLTLASAGSITQATGATLSVTGGNLIVSGSSAITLTNAGNALGSLGALNSTGAIAITNGATAMTVGGAITGGGAVTITTSAAMTLNGNISAGGAIGLTATGLTLGSAVTTSGGAVTIALGAGAYATGGFTLTTTSQNLTLTAGTVTAAADSTVFALGATGTLTASGLMQTVTIPGSIEYFDYDNLATNKKGSTKIGSVNPNDAAITKWKFYGGTAGTAAADTAWMNAESLKFGMVVEVVTTAASLAGLAAKDSDGNVKWKAASTSTPGTPTEKTLSGNHEISFVGVGTSATRATVAANIASSANKASALIFTGNNFFTGNLNLNSTGSITQLAADKIDLASGNSLALSGTTISLAGTSNVIGSLGVITATTGLISITTTGTLTLTDTITSGGAISLTAGGMTLTKDITTSGGAVTISLGATGVYTTGGFTLTTSNQSLSLTAGSVTAADNFTVFALGTSATAILTLNGISAAVFTPGSTTYFNYDEAASDKKGTPILDSVNPLGATTKWKFYGSTVMPVTESNTAWLNTGSLAAGKFVTSTTGESVSTAGLAAKDSDGNVKWKVAAVGSGTPTLSINNLSGSHDVTFVSVGASGAGGAVAVGALPTAASVVFSGANFLTGNVTLNATGSITQTSGVGNTLSVTGGNLVVNSSGSITLTNAGNALGSLGALNSSGSIAVTSDGATTLTGNIATTGSMATISLTAVGVSIGDSITVSGGDLSLTAGNGAVTQAAGKTLTLTGGNLVVNSSGSITLTNAGNALGSLGALSSSGAIAVTSGVATTLNGNITTTGNSTATIAVTVSGAGLTLNKTGGLSITAGGAINLTATGMTLASAVASSGGAVTISLGSGSYSNGTGTGFAWTTNTQNLRLESSAAPNITGIGFVMGSGIFTYTYQSSSGQAFVLANKDRIFVSTRFTQADKDAIKANYGDAEFHSLDDINKGASTSGFSGTVAANGDLTGNISFSNGAKTFVDKDATITFWNVRNGSITVDLDTNLVKLRQTFNGKIVFAGSQNSFTNFDFTTESSAKMVVKANSILSGAITVVEGGIDFEAGATARSGSLTAAAGKDLNLNFQSDFVQMADDAKLVTQRNHNLVITSNGNSVRLMNRGNDLTKLNDTGTLIVTTKGGNFQIAAATDMKFSKLETMGGWVALDAAGSITATGVSAGSVSFRAGGSVYLNGTFAAASGTGASVSLINSAAGSVLGGIRSDSSVTIGGTGSSILDGDIIGGSSVTVGTSVAVAQNSAVVASGGRVEFVRTVAALNALAGLRVDAGYGGIIALGGSIGSPSLSLGWVELTGEISNTTSQGVFYTGGNRVLTHGGKVKNWRNGSEF